MKPTSKHSFAGANVLSWRLSTESLEIEVSNAYFEGEARGRARLTFPLLKPARMVFFDPTRNMWIEEPVVEPLKEIRQLNFKLEKHYSLNGIGADSGRLISVGVLSSEAEISW